MKNRVGTLYGKPVVIGDKNLVTDNEIHVSNLTNNKADVGGSSYVEYYKLNDKLSNLEEKYPNSRDFLTVSTSIKIVSPDIPINLFLRIGGINSSQINDIAAFSFTPMTANLDGQIQTAFSFIDIMKNNIPDVNPYDLVTPITANEYYDL